jgi:hypothetical protein
MKPELEFYDVKSKSKFKSTDWRIEMKPNKSRTQYFAVSKVPNATHEAWKIVSEVFGKENV